MNEFNLKIIHYNSNDQEVLFDDPDVQYSIFGNLKICRNGERYIYIEKEDKYVDLSSLIKK